MLRLLTVRVARQKKGDFVTRREYTAKAGEFQLENGIGVCSAFTEALVFYDALVQLISVTNSGTLRMVMPLSPILI